MNRFYSVIQKYPIYKSSTRWTVGLLNWTFCAVVEFMVLQLMLYISLFVFHSENMVGTARVIINAMPIS